MKRVITDRPILEIVADGAGALGYGHLGRCLAVAEQLDGEVTFALKGEAAAFVAGRGARVGACPQAPVVLIDRRRATELHEVRGLAATGRRVVLLDDLGSGRAEADLVIDPPTAAAWPPTPAWRLGGFEHVLLRSEVRHAHPSARPAGVLVAMGGSDPTGASAPLAEALHGAGLEVTVNLGPGFTGRRPSAGRVLEDRFVEALSEAELLVASYGHGVLEAAYLGVPTIVVVTLPEHRLHASAFGAHGTAEVLDMEPHAVAVRACALLADGARREAMRDRGPRLIDGRGAERVAEAIAALTSVPG